MAYVVEVFPRRPLKLAADPGRRKWRIAFLIFIALCTIPALYWGSSLWRTAALRSELRANGVHAAETMDADGECTSRRDRISNRVRPINCRFNVSYRLRPEEGGAVRTAELRIEGASPIFTPPVVYDPKDPSRAMFAPEVERDMTWSEFIVPFVLLILPAILLMVFFLTGRRGLAVAARNPQPLIVPIEQAVRSQGRIHLHTRAPGADKAMVDSFGDPKLPLLVVPPAGAPPGQQWALALGSPKGRHYVLDSDLAWLDLTDHERQAVLAAARGT